MLLAALGCQLIASAAAASSSRRPQAGLPSVVGPQRTAWTPPPADSPGLLPFLRDTSRPKLAYSTWAGWYTDGGLNETVVPHLLN